MATGRFLGVVFRMSDAMQLERFVVAQDPVLDQVRRELAAGRKRTHWMWFIFPQLRGLGHSAMAQHYGLASLAEARAYLAHPLLGPRLEECTALVNAVQGHSAHAIFGSPDDMKFRSCMTLFAAARPGGTPFQAALDRYFRGEPDPRTLTLLA
ncbi:DUF1810 domain-containing protein [Roseicella aerolata]|uniref:DUF1810 domain-containing protein n=1 Tax=Roseicella aerolata TaxID=2883479 RepID=A0A9X1IGW8_9PROT|nr:DUF1810 domain-containing protein [Roseicella aerolata]MCB4824385.1 DUF1810 domain-containing protein [Roseicella aerolata]